MEVVSNHLLSQQNTHVLQQRGTGSIAGQKGSHTATNTLYLPTEQTEDLTCRCKPAQAASTAQPKFVVVVSPLPLVAAGVVLGVDSRLGLLTGELLTGDVTGLSEVVTVVTVVLLS